MAKRGFGELIAQRRIEAGLTPEQLAERLGRKSKSVVYRIEAEDQEPSVEQINAIVSTLPLSAEELLRAMGVLLNPPAAARLPRGLVDSILALPPEEWPHLERLARGLAGLREQEAQQWRGQLRTPGAAR
jgi:transcriptional regulator with XRE-family HTH domain